jgi:hypothetical protein
MFSSTSLSLAESKPRESLSRLYCQTGEDEIKEKSSAARGGTQWLFRVTAEP